MPFETTTARLLLTRPTDQDRGFHTAVHSDPRLYTHAPRAIGTPESNAEFFDAIIDHWARHGFGYWVARDRASGMPLGWVGVQRRDDALNLYYRFVPEAHGRGLAREAARAAVAIATEWQPDHVVRARVRDHNDASIRTAEAAGLVRTGERLVLADDHPDEPPSSVFEAPKVERVELLDDATRQDLLDLWCRTNDSGGAVGFLPGAPVERVAEVLAAHEEQMASERAVGAALRLPDGTLAGWTWRVASPNPLLAHGRWLYRVMVDPRRQGRGLGLVLMAGVHRIAREDGVELLQLAVRSGSGASRFYAQCGYVEVGRVPGAIRVALATTATTSPWRDGSTASRCVRTVALERPTGTVSSRVRLGMRDRPCRRTAYAGPMASLDDLLHAAVQGVGGVERPGQVEMAHAVEDAVAADEHLLVQAGTGTGKSLAYLIPAVMHAQKTGKPAVVATATLALQAQIVDRDMPRLAESIAPLLGKRPTYGLVKGRRNYLCAHKLEGGFPDDEDGLFEVGEVDRAASRLGQEVVRLRAWAETTESGDRDELVPGVSERAWRQVSVSAHECMGSKCPAFADCFVERSREAAKDCDVIVTNHSFMAIDSFEGRQMLPEHDLLVVDEAHELVDRVTSTITDEITPSMVAAAAKRAARIAESTDAVEDASVFLQGVLDELPEGKLNGIPDALALALARVRDTSRQVQSELKPEKGVEPDGARKVAQAAVDEMFENSSRILEQRDLDVVWVSRDQRRGSVLRVAPMSVAMLLRDKVFGDRTVIMTSATLELGGTFDAVAGTMGLRGEGAPEWRGLDVGSPFDYPQQAIAYVAQHLPAPGRDGLSAQTLDEIEALVRAAGGRTLGLFSSMRAAKEATEAMRERFEGDIGFLCQGEDQITTLVRQFARDPRTCLFGTLTLWQGVDVPGSACQLVIIDRIPFPRPDDPLSSARSQAIARMGGNGFMAVSATHAALRLSQGAGRLIRRADDRGVVAFLDSRMMTARYAGFLQRSLPPFWPTTDRERVLAALQRLDETAAPPMEVHEPALRGVTGALAGTTMGATSSGGTGADSAEHPRPVADPPPPAEAARTAVTSGHAWTAESDEELRDGVELGLSVDELAESLELPADVVAARLKGLGLEASGAATLSFD